MGKHSDITGTRLTPTMSSRTVAAYDFIVGYIRQHNGLAPSLGEISAAIGVPGDRTAARRAVAALVAKGLIFRVPGTQRALALPSERERAIQELRKFMVVDQDVFALLSTPRATFSALPVLPEPPHTAGGGSGSGDGGVGADGG